ncbi:hypothetical protein PVAP13_7KG053118 [Panicum virgatum]|uniref:Uncharacterized protein n=1 Tax=Panicum virgatum TaxID=38727 RepID=A0A8T0QJZ9_PANVG|nr:hypothetical protein PVAP13_7KG053118 [Panicum virgatum]
MLQPRSSVNAAAALVQAMVFVLVLCPLAAAYVFGLYVSTGVSLWRIIERDYVDASDKDDPTKNLRPALNVLYSLALLQGGLFCYRAVFSTKRNALINYVVGWYKLDNEGRGLVMSYFHATRIGCAKDPAFARGRKLLTYAVDLMDSSRSPESYLSAARFLYALLHGGALTHSLKEQKNWSNSPEKMQLFRMLLRMLESANPHGEEAREFTARIVYDLAHEFQLKLFPTWWPSIKSLLEDEEAHHSLALWGVRILTKLASGHIYQHDNRRAMSDTTDLLSKVMATPNPAWHHSSSDHDAWSNVAEKSLSLLRHLMESPGEAGAKLRRQGNEAICANAGAIESILICDMCHIVAQKKAMEILQDPPGDEARRSSVAAMITIFSSAKNDFVRRWGRKELEKLISTSESNASLILQAKYDAFATLTDVLVDARNNACQLRIPAASILERLCYHSYSPDDEECLKKLKKDVVDAVPKVLGEILRLQAKLVAATAIDIEEGRDQRDSYPTRALQQADTELLGGLLSLCGTMWDKLVRGDQELARKVDELSARACSEANKPGKSFSALLKEARETHTSVSFGFTTEVQWWRTK